MMRNEQLEELILGMRQTKDKRLFERYQAVFLHLEGKNNVEIAAIIQRNQATVGEYIKAYKQEGITGYTIRPRESALYLHFFEYICGFEGFIW